MTDITLQPPASSVASSPVIEMIDVCRRFDTTPPVWALRDVNLTINQGDHVAIVGPSGSGKSTLLNVLGLLDRATSGVYRLNGVDVNQLDDGARAGARASHIGFIFQSFHLLPNRTVIENVMMAGIYSRRPRAQRRELALDALARVGLAHRAGFLPNRLSGGERQRVAVARALATEPALLLCDEPTGNLDSATTNTMLDLFAELVDSGLTMVIITHEQEVADHAKRRVRITDGHLVEQ